MLVCIGTVDNFIVLPSPVLDESPQGYHLEQRLQVRLQAAANDRQLMIEFRLGEGSEAPSEQLLTAWLESGDVVEALCTGLSARPFVQHKDKTYRRQGKAVQVGDETAHLDTMVVFAGASMSPRRGHVARRGRQSCSCLLQARAARVPRPAQRRAGQADGGAGGGTRADHARASRLRGRRQVPVRCGG